MRAKFTTFAPDCQRILLFEGDQGQMKLPYKVSFMICTPENDGRQVTLKVLVPNYIHKFSLDIWNCLWEIHSSILTRMCSITGYCISINLDESVAFGFHNG